MALTAGTRLGPYEITAQIGVGGMGEVYRATDTNLGRQVAIKVLPEAVASDAERLARFDREARTLAALNHPNIAQIHGLERADGQTALVMELVEGPTLADRLAQGPIPVDEALPIAKQMAEALEAAHEQGIIHRDLKPANIKVRDDGTVKVLDFGLAKALKRPGGSGVSGEPGGLTQSPTITTPAMTGAGIVLGTAAYMSPEQARGRTVDKRTDIWAFGAVLFEMLTGREAFRGNDVAETLAEVLKQDPDLAALPPATPRAARRVLRRCLEKDERKRLRDLGDARLELEEALTESAEPLVVEHSAPARQVTLYLATGVVAALVAGVAVWTVATNDSGSALRVRRLVVALSPEVTLAQEGQPFTLSPDGSRLVYAATGNGEPPQLYVRPLDEFESRPLPGTRGATSPFFSPDGQQVAFFAGGQLRVMRLDAGTSRRVTDAVGTELHGGWATNQAIVFGGRASTIQRVSVESGERHTVLRGPLTINSLQVLPDGWLLFGAVGDTGDLISVVAPSSDEPKTVVEGRSARYLSTGHLVYSSEGQLLVAAFDLARHELAGAAVPIVGSVDISEQEDAGGPVAIASDGTLAYVAGARDPYEVVEVNRSGEAVELVNVRGRYGGFPRMSPDGRELAITRRSDRGTTDIYIHDLVRGTAARRLTFSGRNMAPVWDPTGSRLAFASDRGGATLGVYSRPVDASRPAEALLDRDTVTFPTSWSPDGRVLAFVEVDSTRNFDVGFLHVETGEIAAALEGPFNERDAAFSPDGRWLAYVSDETGRDEVYARSYPALGAQQTISTDGGREPVWSPNGDEIFFRNGSGLYAAALNDDGSFQRPQLLFDGDYEPVGTSATAQYDIAPDGEHFVLLRRISPPGGEQIRIVLNWTEELKRGTAPN